MRLTLRHAVLTALLILLLTLTTSAYALSTSFEEFAVGTLAPSISLPGVTFSSDLGAGSWRIQSAGSAYASLSGHVLNNVTCGASLIMRFSSPQTEISLRFGTNPGTLVSLDGWMGPPGGALVFNISSFGSPSSTGKYEGGLSASGMTFDHAVVYAQGGCAAIDGLSLPDIRGDAFDPGDDRLNRVPWASTTVYCREDGIHVYAINVPAPDDRVSRATGYLLFIATWEEIDRVGAMPSRNRIIDSGIGPFGAIQLWRLTSGEFQLHAPGLSPETWKPYDFIWHDCPRPENPSSAVAS